VTVRTVDSAVLDICKMKKQEKITTNSCEVMIPFSHRLLLSIATGCSHSDCCRNRQPVPEAAAGLGGASGASASPLSNPNAPTVSADGMVGSLSRIGGLVVLGNQVLPTATKITDPITATTKRNLLILAKI
jgi:hypothetical protein